MLFSDGHTKTYSIYYKQRKGNTTINPKSNNMEARIMKRTNNYSRVSVTVVRKQRRYKATGTSPPNSKSKSTKAK